MNTDELRGRSREELVELISRQQVEHRAAIEQRNAKIQELEGELAQVRRPAKTPEDSSVPPLRGQKATRPERRGRKRGPKRGHVGTSRRRSEPAVVGVCRPTVCSGCGGALPATGGQWVGRSQVVEPPPMRPVVVEAHQYAVTCSGCGTHSRGTIAH